MRKADVLVVVLCLIILWSAGHEAAAVQRRKPAMPPIFISEQQLLQYLKELDDYYLIIGKPRFGRSIHGDE
ncbi:hypothetical protein MRX96_047624 [Rhipicephalus microplus]